MGYAPEVLAKRQGRAKERRLSCTFGGPLIAALTRHDGPRWRKPRCGPDYDRRQERYWRHMAVGPTVLWLRYAPMRAACPDCGVTVEQVPRARHASRFTLGLEYRVA